MTRFLALMFPLRLMVTTRKSAVMVKARHYRAHFSQRTRGCVSVTDAYMVQTWCMSVNNTTSPVESRHVSPWPEPLHMSLKTTFCQVQRRASVCRSSFRTQKKRNKITPNWLRERPNATSRTTRDVEGTSVKPASQFEAYTVSLISLVIAAARFVDRWPTPH